jgi:hypothetical protein
MRTPWKTMAEAITDPDDRLIVEGDPASDPALEGVAVDATTVTTKKPQVTQRQATESAP